MNNPLLSVIIASFNNEEYIEECVGSVIRQTYENLEIICVDDGSTDKTGILMDNFARVDSRIHVFHHKENKGVSAARNLAMNHVNGEFLTFVDGDDYIKPEMYETLIEVALRQNADIVCSPIVGRKVTGIGDEICFSGSDALIETMKRKILDWSLSNKILKTGLSKGIRWDESCTMAEDMLFFSGIVYKAGKVVLLNKEFYYWRNNPNSATRSKIFNKAYMSRIDAVKKVLEFFHENMPEHEVLAERVFLVSCIALTMRIVSSKNRRQCKDELAMVVSEYKSHFKFSFLEGEDIKTKVAMVSLKLGIIPFAVLSKVYCFFALFK